MNKIFELLFEEAPWLFFCIVFVIIVTVAWIIDGAFVSWFIGG